MKKLIALLLAGSLLTGCPSPAPDNSTKEFPGDIATRPLPPGCRDSLWGPLTQAYQATFPNGALDTGFHDSFHSPPQAMEEGDAGPEANGTYDVGTADGALLLNLQAPDNIPDGQTASVGVFATGLDFRGGTNFVARATFQRPDGKTVPPASDDITNAWAVGLTARTGGRMDLAKETRIGVTFRVLDQDNNKVKLSIQDSAPGGVTLKEDVDKALVASVFDKKSPQPFTLELSIDRQSCTGTATLTAGTAKPQTLSFRLSTFLAQSGPRIEAIGPVLATCCAPKSKLSVEVTRFGIWVRWPRPDSTERELPNPPPINPHR